MDASRMTPTTLPRGRRNWGEQGWIAAACAVVVAFYVWTARSEGVSWNFGQRQTDYYNLLVDGFLDGHLHMNVEVSPELLKLADPYNPANRAPGIALHDASMYRGRSYIYFGAGPVVTLMLPFRVLSGGVGLPLPAAVLTFALGGFLASVVLLVGIRRRYFPEAGTVLTVLNVVALGTASMVPLLVLRGSIWELPTSSGYCYAMLALLGVWQSLHAEGRAEGWLASAGLSVGLAVASRPTYLYTSGLLAVPVLWWWWLAHREGAGRKAGWRATFPWSRALAAGLPLGAVGAAMAWYNYARFGSLTEFGVAYQFSGVFEAETRHFRWSYLPVNLQMYWVQAAEWTRYFPFFHRVAGPAIPAGHLGYDDLYGVLVNVPWVWLALGAPLALLRRRPGERGPLGVILGSVAMIAAGMTISLAFFYAAMVRYGPDFMPALGLLAATGALALQRWARTRGGEGARARGRISSGVVNAWCGALIVFSIFFAVLLSMAAYGGLRRQSPRAYARWATLANQPTAWLEAIAGTQHGPLVVTVRWPVRWPAPGAREMLVRTGAFEEGDEVFVQYEEAGRVRIGFAHESGAQIVSRVVAVEPGAEGRLRVEMGSLYPPETHPFFAGMAQVERDRLSRQLRVEWKGDVLLDSYQRFHTSSPAQVVVGQARGAGRAEQIFSGVIVRVEREAELGPIRAEVVERHAVQAGWTAAQSGKKMPLFTVGEGGGRTVWYGVRRSGEAVAIGWARVGAAGWESAPVATDPARPDTIEVVAVVRPGAAGQVFVKVNDVILATQRGEAAPLGGAVTIGVNGTAVGEVAPAFDGLLHRVHDGGPSGEFATVRMTLALPERRAYVREPLVVTGETGRGDFVFVEYLDAERVRFGLDHWGRGTVFSEALGLAGTGTHVIDVSLESFPGARVGAAAAREPQRVRVAVDGREVWARDVRLYAVGARDVFVGRNPLGGTACAPLFTGAMLDVKRLGKPEAVR